MRPAPASVENSQKHKTMKYKITLTFDVDEEGSHLSGDIMDENGQKPKTIEPWVMATLSYHLHDTANKWLKRGLQTGIFPR